MPSKKDESPDWPTTMKMRLKDGRCIGTDNSVWVYRRVPLGPVDDAVDRRSALRVADPLMSAMNELEGMARVTLARRNASRGSYRQVHMLLVNVPKRYMPDERQPLRDWLSWQFPWTTVDNRVLLLGVRLVPSIGGPDGGLKGLRDSVVNTLSSNEVPMQEFDRDFAMVDEALSRSGLTTPSDADFALANAWWNLGLYPDTPVLVHTDHLHVFSAPESLTEAAGLVKDEVPCSDWPTLQRHHTLAMASLMDFQFNMVPTGDPSANWASELLSLGAVAVSVRGRVEPQRVTRGELRRNRKKYLEDIREAAQEGTMQRSEQDEKLHELGDMEGVYARNGAATPTLIDVSAVAALNGSDAQGRYDANGLGRSVNLSSMIERQSKALTETMLCSPVRANPYMHDLPSQMVAASGLPSLSVVGDREGALLGFTERDRQPAYLSPNAASTADGLPMMLVAGATGSGKALALDTRIQTPSGWTTMGEVRVGDELVGRDGRATKVTFVTEVAHDRPCFEMVLSDGQKIVCDIEHQWPVETWQDRHGHRHPKRKLAVYRSDKMNEMADALVEASHNDWLAPLSSVRQMVALTDDILGESNPWKNWDTMIQSLGFVEAAYTKVIGAEIGELVPGKQYRAYDTRRGLVSLALRLRQRFANRPAETQTERVMTAGEMLAEGIRDARGSKFSIRLPEPFDCPDADLPLDPYVLGAWLGDGSSSEGCIASATVASCTDPETGVTDQQHMIDVLTQAGFDATPRSTRAEYVIGVRGLAPKLRVAGLLNNKHIPVEYLRASFAQRLALLQGLMDTDGCVQADGDCDITMTNHRLADDVVELVRSLGIKVTVHDYPNYAPSGRRTEDRRVAYFATNLPVARLPRKARRIKAEVNGRSRRLFVTEMRPVESVPVRCLTVDASDSLFVVESGIVTSNTQTLLWLAYQYANMGCPQVIIDPKALALDTRIPTPSGWTTMRDIEVGDQVFDRYGKPCSVTHKSRVFTTEQTRIYEFVLDDGQVIRADQNHQWAVLDHNARRQMSRQGAIDDAVFIREMTTDQMLAEGVRYRGGRQSNFALPVTGAVQHPHAELGLDPYLLGAWLGDGASAGKHIYAGDEDVEAMAANIAAVWPRVSVSRSGHINVISCDRDVSRCLYGHDDYVEVNHGDRVTSRCGTCESSYQTSYRAGREHDRGTVVNGSLQHALRAAGVLGDKHIPHEYLLASAEQRLALLQGLMDAGGTVKRRGDLRISLTNERLARGVLSLVRSLGFKASSWSGDAAIVEDGEHRVAGTQYVVTFRTATPVFRLARKLAGQPTEDSRRSRLLYVKEIRRVDSEPAQCVRVDSADHTYLVEDYVVTHNTDSDHSDVVLAAGGQVSSLDDLVKADGIFDPLRFAASSEAGLEAASSMLLQTNPWGSAKEDYEAPVSIALSYGVSQGATCIGEALSIALADGKASKEMVDPVLSLAASSPMFRACVGISPQSNGLRVQEGITLIKVGNTNLELPQPGKNPESMGQRVAVSLVRMMVFGSAMALTGRRGVLHLDEAWVALTGGAAEVERLGRLARSQEVFPILYTQRVSDAVNAGLTGYISRGLIMAIRDADEARAACELFKLEADANRMGRITAQATKDGGDTDINGAPNWNSLRALRVMDPDKLGEFKTLRGAVGIYIDLAGRAVPVTINLPPDFLEMSSTNTADLRRKKERKAALERMAATEAEGAASKVGSDVERRAMNRMPLEAATAEEAAARDATRDVDGDGVPDRPYRETDPVAHESVGAREPEDALSGLFGQ